VLLDGGFGINIIIEKLRKRLRLLILKLVFLKLNMVSQITTKPIGLTKNLKIHIHGISYIITFIIIQYSVLDVSYSILLSRPWLKNDKVSHDWGTNLITTKCNGTIKTIVDTKNWMTMQKHL
jgi:hypothetical protein